MGRALSFPADSRPRTVLSANMPQLFPPRKIIVTFVTAKILFQRWKRDSTPPWHYSVHVRQMPDFTSSKVTFSHTLVVSVILPNIRKINEV